jgi:hypothetical protein
MKNREKWFQNTLHSRNHESFEENSSRKIAVTNQMMMGTEIDWLLRGASQAEEILGTYRQRHILFRKFPL